MEERFDIQAALSELERVTNEIMLFEIGEHGFDVLPEAYHNFWRWLFEDEEFHSDPELRKIACYAQNQEMAENMETLYAYVKGHPGLYPLAELKLTKEIPKMEYDVYRTILFEEKQRKEDEELNELYAWSSNFRKFVCNPPSARMLLEQDEKKLAIFARHMNGNILAKALILYTPDQREYVLHSYTKRLQRQLLEDMRFLADPCRFSLSECIKAEQKVCDKINEM